MVVSNSEVGKGNIILQMLTFKFFVGFFLYGCGFILWLVILSRINLNVAFPIAMSLFFITTAIGSYFIIKEPFRIMQFFGMVLCFAGILLISLK